VNHSNASSNNDASGSGAVYLFQRSGTTWSQAAYIKASNTSANDSLGCNDESAGRHNDLAIDDETIIIGAVNEDSNATTINGDGTDNSLSNSGAAYIFQ
jgi:trimeric autotransporter adhesin